MSSAEAPISITVKTAVGSLVTVRAEDGAGLDQVIALGLESIKAAVTELESAVRGFTPTVENATTVIKQAFPNGAVIQQDTPPFSGAPSIGGGRNCPHGKMTAIQGQSKQGGIYKGYFCPSAQGDPSKCKTTYVQKHEPDWNTFVPDRIK
jgi:hypothetical protein